MNMAKLSCVGAAGYATTPAIDIGARSGVHCQAQLPTADSICNGGSLWLLPGRSCSI
jgi:hypothetical protein